MNKDITTKSASSTTTFELFVSNIFSSKILKSKTHLRKWEECWNWFLLFSIVLPKMRRLFYPRDSHFNHLVINMGLYMSLIKGWITKYI